MKYAKNFRNQINPMTKRDIVRKTYKAVEPYGPKTNWIVKSFFVYDFIC